MEKRRGKKKAAISRGPLTPPPARSLLHRGKFWALLLVAITALAYGPVWFGGYIWDDDLVLTQNPVIIGPLGLKEIWTTQAADVCPLTLTIFLLEHTLWGLAPLPYHLVTLGLHAACAIALWRVLLVLRIPGAWLGAALWALHPVQVESVAWVSEMKNTQSGFFYLLAILFYSKGLWEQSPGNKNYLATVVFTALAMASKSSTVVLPVVLGLCAWWIEGRWNWRSAIKLSPLLLLSLATVLVSIWTQSGHNDQAQWSSPLPERLALAGDSIWFYLGKLLWPYPLILIYPRWQPVATSAAAFFPLLAVLALLLLFWLKRTTWARGFLFAWSYFLVSLLPILGLVHNSYTVYSFVADHFQYLASMGPLALAAASLIRIGDYIPPSRFALKPVLAASALLVLGCLTWQRGWVFQNRETIWTDTIAKNPGCWAAYTDLGMYFYDKGRFSAAMPQFRKSIELYPGYYMPHLDLACALAEQGQSAAAIEEFKRAIAIDPTKPQTYADLGVLLLQENEVDEAIAQLRKGTETASKFAPLHNELGLAYARQGQLEAATEEYKKTIEIDPDFAEAHTNLGLLYVQKGQLPDAIAQFEEVVRLCPDSREAQANLTHAQAMAQQAGLQY